MPTLQTPLPAAHGGVLVQQRLTPDAAVAARGALGTAPTLKLSLAQLADVEMLATGAMSPLSGFMGQADHQAVVQHMRLADGTVWPIPITLQVEEGVAAKLQGQAQVGLCNATGELIGSLELTEIYSRDPAEEAHAVYGTADLQHPGVAALLEGGRWCLAGRVTTFGPDVLGTVDVPALTPAETRAYFAARGWQRIVGFQTRHPVHRAHEYIIKCAMEMADGVLLHPLVGGSKDDDIPTAVRLACYRSLCRAVMPTTRTCLSVMPTAMRYAGPKEAILHAIMHQNYGCTHFLIGRDYAGVGDFYRPYAAQEIFASLPPSLLIQPICFENAFFCRRCAQMATAKTCPHDATAHLSLSGSKVREMLRRGERPPPEFSRPEIADILIEWARL